METYSRELTIEVAEPARPTRNSMSSAKPVGLETEAVNEKGLPWEMDAVPVGARVAETVGAARPAVAAPTANSTTAVTRTIRRSERITCEGAGPIGKRATLSDLRFGDCKKSVRPNLAEDLALSGRPEDRQPGHDLHR